MATPNPPSKFFDEQVLPPYKAWLDDPATEWKAKATVAAADNLAERFFKYWRTLDPSKVLQARSVKQFRAALRAHTPDFGLVWDIHDGNKHWTLDRGNRQVTSAEQTGYVPSSWDTSAWDTTPWDGAIIIELDDGSRRNLTGVLANVIAMWERLLA